MKRMLVVLMAVATTVGVVAQTPRRGTAPPAPVGPPKLVVMLVVDQFRADYAQTYGAQWTGGLHRLFTTGAYFPQAAYPYAVTKTCAGHASIGTGMLPSTHGLIDNTWWDRSARKAVTCTEDADATSIAFGGATGTEHHSAKWLRVPTFTDELRLQSRQPPKIVSISLKPRSAIGLAGHGGPNTWVLWEEDIGTWATSSAYAKTSWPEANAFVAAHPITAPRGQTWNRILPASAYLYDDKAPGEPTRNTFPYVLEPPPNQTVLTYPTVWEKSPWSDEYIGEFAMALAGDLKLGQGPGTDVLAISFSALDLMGHDFGPRSHEVQDLMARLDLLLGRLFAQLDRAVGPDKYVVALSADHGIPPMPEQAAALGIAAGRLSTTLVRQAIETALTPALGEGTHVANITSPYVYFAPGVLDRIETSRGLRSAISEGIRNVPGVWRVYWADEIAAAPATDDTILTALRKSYVAGRSGDVAFIPLPYWVPQAGGVTHGSPHGYDQQVPVVFMGAGIKPGVYNVSATPIDIAPTLAALTGLHLAHTDGRVLTEILVR